MTDKERIALLEKQIRVLGKIVLKHEGELLTMRLKKVIDGEAHSKDEKQNPDISIRWAKSQLSH
jgi:hypothetical protein